MLDPKKSLDETSPDRQRKLSCVKHWIEEVLGAHATIVMLETSPPIFLKSNLRKSKWWKDFSFQTSGSMHSLITICMKIISQIGSSSPNRGWKSNISKKPPPGYRSQVARRFQGVSLSDEGCLVPGNHANRGNVFLGCVFSRFHSWGNGGFHGQLLGGWSNPLWNGILVGGDFNQAIWKEMWKSKWIWFPQTGNFQQNSICLNHHLVIHLHPNGFLLAIFWGRSGFPAENRPELVGQRLQTPCHPQTERFLINCL